MAHNAAGVAPVVNVLNHQLGVGVPVPAAGDGRTETPRPSDAALLIVPEFLTTPQLITGHNDYRDVLGALYDTFEVVEVGGPPPARYIRSRFMFCNREDFDAFKNKHHLLGRMEQNIQSLFNVLTMCVHKPRTIQTGILVQRMGVANINAILGTSQQHNFDVEGAAFTVEIVKLWIESGLSSIAYVHQKAKMGLFLNARICNLELVMRELRNEYQRLLASLTNRADVNGLAMYTASQLQLCITEARAYAIKKDERCVLDAAQYLQRYRNMNTFSIQAVPNGLQDTAARNAFLEIHHYKADFNALNEIPLSEHSTALEPILQGIRGFVPSAKETALEQAQNLKPNASALSRDIRTFLDVESPDKSLGAARSFKVTLINMKSMLENLVPHGVWLDKTTTGMSSLDMSAYLTELDDFISSKESQMRRAEAQSRAESQELSKSAPRIELPELSGFSNYLSWKAAADQILPLHTNDLIKKQLVKASLKNKEDLLRCKDINFKEIMSYLDSRYSSPLLIPQLIEEALRMRRAHDNRSSYENLTNFVSLYNQLCAHKQEDKLTMHVRQKLVPILLCSTNMSMFYKEMGKKEAEMKKAQEQAGDTPDCASVVSYALGDEFEEQRRSFWLEEMFSYLNVARKIVSQQQTETPSGKYKNNNRNYSISQEPNCPICKQSHVNPNGVRMTSLTKCEQFRNMLVKQRYAAVKQFSHCVRCLRPRSDPGHGGKGCAIADQTNLVCNHCVPSSKTHHPMLHDADLAKSSSTAKPANTRGGGGGGRGRGGQGRGGRGGARGGHRGGRGGGRGGAHTHHASNTGQAAPDSGPQENELFDNQYDDSQIEPLEPISKDTLLVNAASFKARHLTKFSLDTARIFLTCCALITIKNGSFRKTGVALLDCGSSLGYCTLSFARKTQMRQDGLWEGVVHTIHGAKQSSHPIFIANLEDACGKVHVTKLLGTKKIGFKNHLPDQLFEDLCKDLKVSPLALQNPSGPIDLLLGLDVNSLLGSKHFEITSSRHPELFVCSTPLSSQYFLTGAVGKEMLSQSILKTLTFQTDVTCFHTDIISSKCCDINNEEWGGGEDTGQGWHVWSFMSKPLKLLRSLSAVIRTRLNWRDDNHCSASDQVSTYSTLPLQASDNYKNNITVNALKSSPHCDKLQDVVAIPSINCKDCAKRQASCKVCRYLNSEMSLNDLRELQIIRGLISLRPNPQDPQKFDVFVDYPFTVDPHKAFAPEHSNRIAAKYNSERLRCRLLKIGMADKFQDEMNKVKEQGHIRVRDDFTPSLSPHSFIFLNYVEKSSKVSQSVRPVSNSGATNKKGYSLNSATFSGPNFLNSGLQCLLSFRLLNVAFCADLSRAYRSCKTMSHINDLRLFYWYTDIHDAATCKPHSFEVMNFGDCPAACILECVLREYIGPAAETIEVRECIDSSRLVDDFLGSLRDPSRIPAIREDLLKTTDKFGFKLKSFNYSGEKDAEDNSITTGLLGMNWECTSDILSVQTVFFCGNRRRGKQLGDELSVDEANTIIITRTLVARLAAQAFSYDGVLLGPTQAALRILFSLVCRVLKDWTSSLHTVDANLDKEARQLFCSLVDIKNRIRPIRRELIPKDHKISKIIISTDASLFCYSFLIYFISEDTTGHTASSLVISKMKIHNVTVPAAELSGIAAGTRFLSMDLFSFVPQLKKEIGNDDIHCVVVTDSMCSLGSLSPTKIHRDIRIRNLNILTHRCGMELVSNYNNLKLSFTHQRSQSIPADLCTKLSLDSINAANSSFYRHGCEVWKEKAWPGESSIFLQFCHGKEVKYVAPKSEQELTETHCLRCYSNESFCYADNSLRSLPPPKKRVSSLPKISKYLDKERYDGLLSRCRNFLKALKVLITIINIFRSDSGCTLNEAYLVLLTSHQKHYPPKDVSALYPFLNADNIWCANLRLTEEDGEVLAVDHAPALVSHHDHRLVHLLIQQAHVAQLQEELGQPAHLSAVLTLARLRQHPYAVHISRVSACVKNYIKNCPTCLRYLAKTSRIGLGSPRMLRYFKKYHYCFSVVSIDQVGPYKKSTFPGSRSQVQYYLLLLCCGLTGATSYEFLEKNDRAAIVQALFLHSSRYTKPKIIYCDKSSCVNPQPGSSLYKQYFGEHKCQVFQVEASHQQLNWVENVCKRYKKLVQTAIMTRGNVNLPNLTYNQIRSIMEAVCYILNSKPIDGVYNDQNFLCPLHFMKSDWFLIGEGEEFLDSPSSEQFKAGLELIRRQMGQAQQKFIRILRQTMMSSTRRQLRLSGYDNYFKVNDICLSIKSSGYHLVRILAVFPQYCKVLSSERSPCIEKNVHANMLILIFRHNVSSEALLGHRNHNNGSDDQEGRRRGALNVSLIGITSPPALSTNYQNKGRDNNFATDQINSRIIPVTKQRTQHNLKKGSFKSSYSNVLCPSFFAMSGSLENESIVF